MDQVFPYNVVLEYVPIVEEYAAVFWGTFTFLYLTSLIVPPLKRLASRGKTSCKVHWLINWGFPSKFYYIMLYLTAVLVNSLFCSLALGLIISKHVDVDKFHDKSNIEILKEVTMIILENYEKIPAILFFVQFQVMRRLFESVFLTNFSKTIVRWYLEVVGLIYYLGLSITIAAVEIRAYLMNDEERSGYMIIGGLVVFFIASYFQSSSHYLLASLRSKEERGKRLYRIPRGEWFDWLVCPHYVFEIVIYFSFIIVGGFDCVLLWLIFAFVFIGRVFEAKQTRDWYVLKFREDYPRGRKLLIPFII